MTKYIGTRNTSHGPGAKRHGRRHARPCSENPPLCIGVSQAMMGVTPFSIDFGLVMDRFGEKAVARDEITVPVVYLIQRH